MLLRYGCALASVVSQYIVSWTSKNGADASCLCDALPVRTRSIVQIESDDSLMQAIERCLPCDLRIQCCAPEIISTDPARVLFSEFPAVLFLRTALLSGVLRGLLPIELPFVIIANTPSILDVTRGRKIVSVLSCVRYWSRQGFAELIALCCAKACGPMSRLGTTTVMRGPLPPRRVDRACTLRISRESPDLAAVRARRSLLSRTGVPSIRTGVVSLQGAPTDEQGDRLSTCPSTPVGLASSVSSSSARRITCLSVPDFANAPARESSAIACCRGGPSRPRQPHTAAAPKPGRYQPGARHDVAVSAPYWLLPVLASETNRRARQ